MSSHTHDTEFWTRQDNIALEKSLSVKIEQLAEFTEEIKCLIGRNKELRLSSERSSKSIEYLNSQVLNLQYRLNAKVKSSDERGRKITNLREELWRLRRELCRLKRELYRLRDDARQKANKNPQEKNKNSQQEKIIFLEGQIVRDRTLSEHHEEVNNKTISGLRDELSDLLRDKKDLLSTVSVLGKNIKRLVHERDDLKEELQKKCEVIQRNIATLEDCKDKEGLLSPEVNQRLNAKIVALMHERVGLKKQNRKLASENSTLRAIIEICFPVEP